MTSSNAIPTPSPSKCSHLPAIQKQLIIAGYLYFAPKQKNSNDLVKAAMAIGKNQMQGEMHVRAEELSLVWRLLDLFPLLNANKQIDCKCRCNARHSQSVNWFLIWTFAHADYWKRLKSTSV